MFVLFCWLITALFYLYYEQHYGTRALGAFVMLVISAAVGFLLWYTVAREAQEIQPLVPALQELVDEDPRAGQLHRLRHFSLSAMVGFAYLSSSSGERAGELAPLCCWACCAEPVVFRRTVEAQQLLGGVLRRPR